MIPLGSGVAAVAEYLGVTLVLVVLLVAEDRAGGNSDTEAGVRLDEDGHDAPGAGDHAGADASSAAAAVLETATVLEKGPAA